MASPTLVIEEALIWTVLPQGPAPSGAGKVRMSVFVTPRLTFAEVIGNRTESTSTTLSRFSDFVNWPNTLTAGREPLKLSVRFSSVSTRSWSISHLLRQVSPPSSRSTGPRSSIRTTPGSTVPELENWTTDFTYKPTPLGDVATLAHPLYTSFAQNTSTSINPVTLSAANGAVVKKGSNTHAYDLHTTMSAVPSKLGKVVTLPKTATTTTPPAPPVQDFHSAVARLTGHPEILRLLGLVISFDVTVPTSLRPTSRKSTQSFTAEVVPTWLSTLASSGNDAGATHSVQNVCPPTQCDYRLVDGQNFFVAAPYGGDYDTGMLKVGPGTGKTAQTRITVNDLDLEAAGNALNAYSATLSGQIAAVPTVAEPVHVPVSLPSLRTVGPSLIWDGWGDPPPNPGLIAIPGAAGQPGGPQPFAVLAQRQAAAQSTIVEWVKKGGGTAHPESGLPTLPTFYLEDLTQGWRFDVLQKNSPFEQHPLWQSLHWRTGSYQFGTGGEYQLSGLPSEGWISGAAVSQADGELSAHEVIARWDGWSLSIPRPGSTLDDSGNVIEQPGNPMPPITTVDSQGNYNAQFSAEYALPNEPVGTVVDDPVTGQAVGLTGLPTRRFGQLYSYRARAVDLSGWSHPLNVTGLPDTSTVQTDQAMHQRWEALRAPTILATAALTTGEGPLAVILRYDGVNPAVGGSRWLFPPQAHLGTAELHGFLDDPTTGLPAPSLYQEIARYAAGSTATLPDIASSTNGPNGQTSIHLPVNATNDPVGGTDSATTTWLPDPAAFGIYIGGALNPSGGDEFELGQAFAANSTVKVPNFIDLWVEPGSASVEGGYYKDSAISAWRATWPKIPAKIMYFQPTDPSGTPILAPVLPVMDQPKPQQSGGSDPRFTISVTPGFVGTVQIGSIFSGYINELYTNTAGDLFGLLTWIYGNGSDVQKQISTYSGYAIGGQVKPLTPPSLVTVIYATRLPQVAPTFGAKAPKFGRAVSDTSVTIVDPDFSIDPATTATVTFDSTWTDLVDDPALGAPADVTTNQTLLATVNAVYPPAVPASPLVPTSPAPTTGLPFGVINLVDKTSSTQNYGLTAVQHVGDTKHHHVTYDLRATSRFGDYFVTTLTTTLSETATVLNPDGTGLTTNLVTVVLPGIGGRENQTRPTLTVPPDQYVLNPADGSIALVPGAMLIYGKNPQHKLALSGLEFLVAWAPSDTIPQAASSSFVYDIPSSVAPPALKVARVAPAWGLNTTGSLPDDDPTSVTTRTGNILRVYLDRPWYVTGPNEMVGVVVAQETSSGDLKLTPGLPKGVDLNRVSIMGFDPIAAPAPDPSGTWSMTQLKFVTPAPVPTTATLKGGNPIKVPLPGVSGTSTYEVYGYTPEYDSAAGLWYADIELDVNAFPAAPPPGYFLRLALCRLQPYSTGGSKMPPESPSAGPTQVVIPSNFTSPISLVTIAQPVPDRQVTVTADSSGISVEVTGTAYYGWRHATSLSTDVVDRTNATATHPNSTGGGSPATSTMVVEVQEYDDSTGFTGDLAWKTVPGYTVALVPQFKGATGSTMSWVSGTSSKKGPVKVPLTFTPMRFAISEIDYYGPPDAALPAVIDTTHRRSFVVHIPISGNPTT
jgi:hypothetical protein